MYGKFCISDKMCSKTHTKPMLTIPVKLRHLNCEMAFYYFPMDTCVLSVCVDHFSGQCSCSRHGAVELVVFIVQSDGNKEHITMIISIKMSTTKGQKGAASSRSRAGSHLVHLVPFLRSIEGSDTSVLPL